MLLRLILAAWLGLAPFWLLRPAHADVTGSCTFAMSAIDFGQVNVLSGSASASSGVLTVTCPTASQLIGTTLFACVTFSKPRQITNGGTMLTYDLYGPSPSTTSWSNTTPIQFPLAMLKNNGSASSTVSAAILPGQATAPPGLYSSSVTASVVFGLTGCTVGALYSTTFTFPVRATVASACNMSAQNIAFPSIGLLASTLDAVGEVDAQCTTGSNFSIGLDGGLTAALNPTSRKLQTVGTANTITYGLYRDPARTLPWGSASGTNVQTGVGSAASQRFPVYARIPPQTTPPPGSYSDTVVVTVTY